MKQWNSCVLQCGLVLSALVAALPAAAAAPPAGTVIGLNHIGSFTASANTVSTCVALTNAQGQPLVDAQGQAQIYDITLGLKNAQYVFQLLRATHADTTTGLDCSGTFRDGVYTDQVLIDMPGNALHGAVMNITMDQLPGTFEFQLRLDGPSFNRVRNLATNTTALGADRGDFAASTVREYGTLNLPGPVLLKLPTCSDPQGDETRVLIERNGSVFAATTPGGNFMVNTASLAPGDYVYRSFCSDQSGIIKLIEQHGLQPNLAWIANSAYAEGSVTFRISEGSGPATPGELTFQFGAGTTAGDQTLVRDTMNFAVDFLQSTFGRSLQSATTITTSTTAPGCANGGGAAFTGSRTLTICVGNQGWTVHGPVNKQKILIHEAFHLLQFELKWLGNMQPNPGYHWLVEGAAEYVGWQGVAALNLLDFATARGCMLKEVSDYALQQPPGLPALEQLETPQSFQRPGPVYPLSMLGADHLLTGRSIMTLLDYGAALAAGTPAATGFATAFGTGTAAFYPQFAAHKAGLAVPASYACRL